MTLDKFITDCIEIMTADLEARPVSLNVSLEAQQFMHTLAEWLTADEDDDANEANEAEEAFPAIPEVPNVRKT